MAKLNMLETRTRNQTRFANAIIRTKAFRKSRSKTIQGKKTFNKELRKLKKAADKYDININRKTLPKPFRTKRYKK